MKRLVLILIQLLSAPNLSAQNTSDWEAFVDGHYEEARGLGRAINTVESLTIACRASLVMGGFVEQTQTATSDLHEAINDCIKAHRLSPDHFDAQMSLAIALSFEGKRTRKVYYPRKARLLLEELAQKHPHNPLAYGALAAWHAQVSAAGFFARIALKASRKQADIYFKMAFENGVVDFPLKFEYLKFLARGNKKQRKEARAYAEQLIAEEATAAFDKLLQSRCHNILLALQSGKKRHIKKAVKSASAFSTVKNWSVAPAYPKDKLRYLEHKIRKGGN